MCLSWLASMGPIRCWPRVMYHLGPVSISTCSWNQSCLILPLGVLACGCADRIFLIQVGIVATGWQALPLHTPCVTIATSSVILYTDRPATPGLKAIHLFS